MEEKTTKYFPSNEARDGRANMMWITPKDLPATVKKQEVWGKNIIFLNLFYITGGKNVLL